MVSYTVKQTVVENLNADLDGKQPAGDYPTNASLTESLQSNLLNYTTNRILEIPQDIKLELNNGTLTLKSGSKVYIPNGFEADGTTPKFDVENIMSDVTVTSSYSSLPRFLTRIDTGWDVPPVSVFYSGAIAPAVPSAGIAFWYDTANNLIKMTRDSGSTWTPGIPLPLAIVHTDGTQIVSIDQIFNGFGYIGSTVFALPGVKVQTPNGRNTDGTCKNIIFTNDSVKIWTEINATRATGMWISSSGVGCSNELYYDSKDNINKNILNII